MSTDSESEKISIIMIGDTSVGKSTLMRKFISGQFSDSLAPTLGIELYKKEVTINDKQYLYRIWDTCGQERFRSLSKNYFHNSDGIMLLFDLNSKNSFDNLDKWFNSIKESGCEEIPLILVGTKCDLKNNISEELINNFINENQSIQKYYKSSAKDNIGIEEPFIELGKLIIKKIGNIQRTNSKIIIKKSSSNNIKPKKKCC